MRMCSRVAAVICFALVAACGGSPVAPSLPALHVTVTVTPTDPQPVHTIIRFTATVTSDGPIPPSLTYAWSYFHHGAAGVTDAVWVGPSPFSVIQTFNDPHTTELIVVTVSAPDGRTATGSVTLPVE